jgi:hypothetical protein
MAQPSTGPRGSGQVAGPPGSRDERDDGGRISGAAALANAHDNTDRGPIE